MNNSKTTCYHKEFSPIYVEKRAFDYPLTKYILEKLSKASVITINHYKDIFNRSSQNFNAQKKSPKIILAVKEGNFLYPGPDVCQSFGFSNFWYSSLILNCMYNCGYCYLQGMYPSSNIVVFVNVEDFKEAISDKLTQLKSLYLSISYDTDLLAFEGFIPLTRMFIEYSRNINGLTIEIRTKSTNFSLLQDVLPHEKFVLAWSVSPQEIQINYENKTPKLEQRIENINHAIAKGYKVRLCLDPVIYGNSFKEIYGEFIDYIFTSVNPEKIYDVSFGAFRMPSDYLKAIKKMRSDVDLIFYPFVTMNNVASYDNTIQNQINDYMRTQLLKYVNSAKIFSWNF